MFDLGPYMACAAGVAPATIQAIVQVESGGQPYALGVNGIGAFYPASKQEAAVLLRRYLALGYRVDAGLMQINSDNFAAFGLAPETVFEPCANLRAGAAILTGAYRRAAAETGAGQVALQQALSAYNTGSFQRGFQNGYVGRYYRLETRYPVLSPDPDLLRKAATSGTKIPLRRQP